MTAYAEGVGQEQLKLGTNDYVGVAPYYIVRYESHICSEQSWNVPHLHLYLSHVQSFVYEMVVIQKTIRLNDLACHQVIDVLNYCF